MKKGKKLTGEELALRDINLSKYDGEDKMVSSHDLAKELEKTADKVFTILTGVPTLDRLLDQGVELGELIVITGPPGEGKTTLLMSITQNMSEEQIKSSWFTLEVTPRQFLSKIVKSSKELPLFFLPNKNVDNTLDWLEERIIEAKIKYKTNVVFIDHIHQIFSLERVSTNISLEIGDMVAKIKDIAIKNDMVIFLIAHSKDPSTPTAEPRMQDIRDSGLITRLADTVIGVWRIPNDDDGGGSRRKVINEDDTKAKIRVFKNRRDGRLGSFVMYHKNHYLSEEDDWGELDEDIKREEKPKKKGKKEINTDDPESLWGDNK